MLLMLKAGKAALLPLSDEPEPESEPELELLLEQVEPFFEFSMRTRGRPFSILTTRSPPELVVKVLHEMASRISVLAAHPVLATGMVMSSELDDAPRLESSEIKGFLATRSSLADIPVRFICVV